MCGLVCGWVWLSRCGCVCGCVRLCVGCVWLDWWLIVVCTGARLYVYSCVVQYSVVMCVVLCVKIVYGCVCKLVCLCGYTHTHVVEIGCVVVVCV